MTELRLESITKTYARGRRIQQALADVSLVLAVGEFVAIHGEPRSGKSTLLRIAAGIEVPDSGSVRYAGRELALMSERELTEYRRDHVAWIPANRPSLAGYGAIDFVALPGLAANLGARDARLAAHKALELTGAEGCADAALHELSDSECRRVAIAQALVRQPRVLLADEPVYGLGSIESRQILALLRELVDQRDFAVLLTAGDASELLGATHVLGLSNGGRMLDPTPDRGRGGQVFEFPPQTRASAPDAGA